MNGSTSSVPLYVVDASVAVKWQLRDEPDADLALAVLADFRDGHTQFVAPAQLRYEVASAIRNALRMNRLTIADGRTAISEFLAWGIPVVDDDALIGAAYLEAVRFGCSFYDGLYLALANRLGSPFVFADNHLRNALGTQFLQALWLTDYVPHP